MHDGGLIMFLTSYCKLKKIKHIQSISLSLSLSLSNAHTYTRTRTHTHTHTCVCAHTHTHKPDCMVVFFGWQDPQVSWNTTDPDFTPCFQKTVLSWIPVAFLLLMAPIKLYTFCHLKDRIIKWNWLNCSKLVTETLH